MKLEEISNTISVFNEQIEMKREHVENTVK
jgi:hypothetical protein